MGVITQETSVGCGVETTGLGVPLGYKGRLWLPLSEYEGWGIFGLHILGL